MHIFCRTIYLSLVNLGLSILRFKVTLVLRFKMHKEESGKLYFVIRFLFRLLPYCLEMVVQILHPVEIY